METRGSAPQEDLRRNGQLSAAKEASGKAVANCFVSAEWGNPSRNSEIEKPLKENESTKEPSLLQYLYVQSPAGKGRPVLVSLGVVRSHTGCLYLCASHLTTLVR